MENSSALECSLSSTSAKTLSESGRLILAKLDRKMPLLSQNGYCRDYRGLAGFMGFSHETLMELEKDRDISERMYEVWERKTDSTIGQLLGYLENMDRQDVIQEILCSIERDNAESQRRAVQVNEENNIAASQECPIQVNEVTSQTMYLHSKRSLLTRQDILNGRITIYDAYLCFADEDNEAVFELASNLESSFKLELFIPERDMLAGHLELDTYFEMIMHRCRHMLMIFTPNFVRKNILKYLVYFSTRHAVQHDKDILIPVKLEPCDIPAIISGVNIIDFTKPPTKFSTQRTKLENLVLSMRKITTNNSSGSTSGERDQ